MIVLKCPQCGSKNKPESKFCENCGTPLNRELSESSFSLDSPSFYEKNSSSPSPSKNKKWLIWGVTLLILIGLGGVGIYFFQSYFSSDKKSSEIETQEERIVVKFPDQDSTLNGFTKSLEEVKPDIKTSTEQNRISINEKSEEQNQSVATQEIIVVASNNTKLKPVAESLIASNYSGAACAVMALSVQDISASQSAIGNQLGLDEGKISDYRDLTNLINRFLSINDSSFQYTGSYFLLDETTAEEKMDAYELFLKRIDQDLKEGKAPLMVIGETPDGLLQRNSYALIYGKDDEDETYTVMVPFTDKARSYEVDLKTLANMFAAPEAFCYIY